MGNHEGVSSFLQYLHSNNLYVWAMSQPLPTGGFKWVGDVNRFTPDEIQRLASKGYPLEVDVKYLKNHMICIMTSHLCVRS